MGEVKLVALFLRKRWFPLVFSRCGFQDKLKLLLGFGFIVSFNCCEVTRLRSRLISVEYVTSLGASIPALFMYVCVHPCLLMGTRIWKHTRTVGSVQLLGTFWGPQKKDPLNRLFMASKPYNWGHFRGPHKLVKN